MDQRNQFERRSQPQSQLGRFRRIRPSVCFFFKSGRTCRLGDKCPMAHKFPRKGERTTGISDPNPDPKTIELLAKAVYMGPLDPPRDETIKTLYIRRLNSSVHEEHLRDRFSPYGEIESIVYFGMRGVSCAFLTYTTRQAAEKAMLEHSSWVDVNGQRLKLLWGANRIPKDADGGGGFALEKDGEELVGWSKRGYGSSEMIGGCGFVDGRRGWGNLDAGGGLGRDNYSGGGSNCVNQVVGSSCGQQDGGGGPSLGDGGGFGGRRGGVNWGSWDFNSTSVGDDDVKSSGEADDSAWGYKPNAGASSSSGSPSGTGDQW